MKSNSTLRPSEPRDTGNAYDVTIDCLDSGSFGVLLSHFTAKERIQKIALVCKAWQRLQQEVPYQPGDLQLQPRSCSDAFMAYHLQDTSKLKVLGVSKCPDSDKHLSLAYWERISKVLNHMRTHAPALLKLDLVPPGPSEVHRCDFLPMVGGLTSLWRLELKDWCGIGGEFRMVTCLTTLKCLKALELAKLHWSAEVDQQEKSKHATLLQSTLLALAQLTLLDLYNVDVLDASCGGVLPTGDCGSLTGLRALAYGCSLNNCSGSKADFPPVGKLALLTYLEVRCHESEPPLATLSCLRNLRELYLTLHHGGYMHELSISGATQLTKLRLNGHMAGSNFERVLSIENLRSVKHLSFYGGIHWPAVGFTLKKAARKPEWPSSWAQLTNLTRLSLECFGLEELVEERSSEHHFPVLYLNMANLRLIRMSASFANLDFLGMSYFPLLFELPCLNMLLVYISMDGGRSCQAKKLLKAKFWVMTTWIPGSTSTVGLPDSPETVSYDYMCTLKRRAVSQLVIGLPSKESAGGMPVPCAVNPDDNSEVSWTGLQL